MGHRLTGRVLIGTAPQQSSTWHVLRCVPPSKARVPRHVRMTLARKVVPQSCMLGSKLTGVGGPWAVLAACRQITQR